MVNRKSQWRIVREVARLDGGGDTIPRSCVRNKGGLTGKDSKRDSPDKQQHRSYSMIAKKEGSRFEDRRVCVCCQNQIGHRVWNCNKFITECSVDQR